MAYTKIFAIRRRLDDRVKYAIDGEKTELDAGIAYAVNPEKTGQVRFVKILNCNDDNAFDAMRAVKRKFKKTGGVLGYHIIQSFAPGEVTPEQAHEIGIITSSSTPYPLRTVTSIIPPRRAITRRSAPRRTRFAGKTACPSSSRGAKASTTANGKRSRTAGRRSAV